MREVSLGASCQHGAHAPQWHHRLHGPPPFDSNEGDPADDRHDREPPYEGIAPREALIVLCREGKQKSTELRNASTGQ